MLVGSNFEAVLLSKTKSRITYMREGEKCIPYEEGNKHMCIACICKRDITTSKRIDNKNDRWGNKVDGVVCSFLCSLTTYF